MIPAFPFTPEWTEGIWLLSAEITLLGLLGSPPPPIWWGTFCLIYYCSLSGIIHCLCYIEPFSQLKKLVHLRDSSYFLYIWSTLNDISVTFSISSPPLHSANHWNLDSLYHSFRQSIMRHTYSQNIMRNSFQRSQKSLIFSSRLTKLSRLLFKYNYHWPNKSHKWIYLYLSISTSIFIYIIS